MDELHTKAFNKQVHFCTNHMPLWSKISISDIKQQVVNDMLMLWQLDIQTYYSCYFQINSYYVCHHGKMSLCFHIPLILPSSVELDRPKKLQQLFRPKKTFFSKIIFKECPYMADIHVFFLVQQISRSALKTFYLSSSCLLNPL